MNAIVPRDTIETIYANREAALRLYEAAFARIAEADEAIKAAHSMAARFRSSNNYSYSQEDEVKAFHNAVNLPEVGQYMRVARKLTNIAAWAYVMDKTDLERLMDKEAKDKLRAQMAYVPDRRKWSHEANQVVTAEHLELALPEFTVDNVYATIQQFAADAPMIFRRGIANVFSKLDRRFRSHDGFKIGSRLILTYFFSDGGDISYGSTSDMMIDIERVFSILDGKPEAQFTSALNAVSADRQGSYGRRQSKVETEYFRIKGYMNGNAHLWFTRDDLVEKVNKLLAEWYGEVIGDGQMQEADPFADVKHLPAKYFGFYPTPEDAAGQLFNGRGGWSSNSVHCLQRADKPQLRVLEPSAGTGNLARRCMQTPEEVTANHSRREHYLEEYRRDYRWDNLVDVVELQSHLAAGLEAAGIYNRVYHMDFLRLTPETTGLYDIVVMNPPFDLERDIDHVMHALKFLKPGGALHAVMSAGTEFRETKKATAFRAVVEQMGGSFEDLPANSFSEVGTNVNTVIVRLRKPA